MIDYERLKTAMGELDDETVVKLIEDMMDLGGEDVHKAVAALQEGMNHVGELFETGEYFVADLIFAGELMKQAMELLKPALANKAGGGTIGKMILCTVEGDLHDIGKNIVKSMMEAGGFEVLDLGIDVSPAAIVKAAKENDIKIIGLSGVLTLAIDSMKATVDALKAEGMRDKVRVIVGGAPVTAEYCKTIGGDAWSLNAAEGVNICRRWAAQSTV